jgi:hypothetical protein
VNGVNLSVLSFDFSATGGTSYAIAADRGGFNDGFLSLAIGSVARPILLNTILTGGRFFGFQFGGPPGSSYTIEASSDLQVWTPIASGTMPLNGNLSFSDPVGSLSRFYRVKRF